MEFGRFPAPASRLGRGRAIRFNLFVGKKSQQKGFSLLSLTQTVVTNKYQFQ